MHTYQAVRDAQVNLHQATVKHWLTEVFSFNWWLLVGFSVLPLVVWAILVDKRKFTEITLYGMFISQTSFILDTIGFSIGLWGYPNKLIPFNPPLFPMDFSALPVAYMLIYQYYPKLKDFIIANALASLFYSFIGEPIFVWLGAYKLHGWKYIYSAPIYFVMALGLRWITHFFVVKVDESILNRIKKEKYKQKSKGKQKSRTKKELFNKKFLLMPISVIISLGILIANKKRKIR